MMIFYTRTLYFHLFSNSSGTASTDTLKEVIAIDHALASSTYT